jgi:carbamoyltransferase
MLRAARHVHERTGARDLCLAGGVSLNCVGNGRILREGPFERVWIQPAAGDAGGALGAALFVWYQLLDHPRHPGSPDGQSGSLLGPRYSDAAIREFLSVRGARSVAFDDEQALCDHVATLIDEGKVVGFFQGRMEFGPRALGCRSILGDARSPEMQSMMNLKIKFRESFRPFAPIVLRERASEFFDLDPDEESPYMLVVAPVADAKRVNGQRSAASGLDKLKVIRSEVPAVTHVDYSARVQTVDPVRHGRLYRLMKAFEARTGCPVLINTSFNVRGEPIVCSPEEAFRCFMATNMDVLVLENHVLLKTEQPDATKHRLDEYLSQFALD